jgi:uncharacterized protein (DUF1810 family)
MCSSSSLQAYAGGMAPDPHQLQRFVDAQAAVWGSVTDELASGRKTSHWMWFVFPQLAVLGRSATAKFYGIRSVDEAKAYLAHPLLGPRLIHCVRLLLDLRDRSALQVFGAVDAMKLRSCLTLFAAVAPHEPALRDCLERFFDEGPDSLTLQQLPG